MNKVRTLIDCCNITTGKLDANHFVPNGKYPFFTCAKDPISIDSFSFDDDVILVAGNNASGNFHLNRYRGKFDAYQRTYILTAKISVDLDYVYYSLATSLQQLKQKSQGSQTKFLTMPILTNLPVPEQGKDEIKIAAILKAIDSKIELNNKINAELEKMAKTLYDYWFVQFDFPDINGKPYKSSGGKMVWSETLKRKIPELWEVKKISSKIKIGSGYPFKTEDYDDKGKYRIITIKSVQKGNLDTSKADKINFIPDNISGFCKLEKGDVLISLTGNVGRLCFVDQDDLLLNQRVGKLLADSNFANYGYLYFNRQENQKRLEKIANGSSQSNLSPVEAVKDSFPIPEKNILERFSDISNPLFQAIIKTKEENQKFVELRDWLLPMLMNGQVVVN